MKIRIDDVRFPPDKTWDDQFRYVLNRYGVQQAFLMFYRLYLKEFPQVDHISFDHDLGDQDQFTGYDLLSRLLKTMFTAGILPPKISLHTANPVGRKRMEAVLAEYGLSEYKM